MTAASALGRGPRGSSAPSSALLDHLINIDAPCAVEQRNPKLPGSRVHALYERMKCYDHKGDAAAGRAAR